MSHPYFTDHHQAATPGDDWAAVPAAQTTAQPASTPTGMLAWSFGLLALFPLMGVGAVFSGIGQIIAGLLLRSRGELAARNGVNAANWGALTVLIQLAGILALGAYLVLVSVSPSFANSDISVFILVVGVILFHLVTIGIQLYAAIRGMVAASNGRVLRLPAPRIFTPPESREPHDRTH